MKWLRELCATALVQVGMWCVDLATAIDGHDGDTREAPGSDPDEAPPQAPITAEAAELLAPPIERKRTKKTVDKPLRGSIRARREKAATL